jgi:hypothetical protein
MKKNTFYFSKLKKRGVWFFGKNEQAIILENLK